MGTLRPRPIQRYQLPAYPTKFDVEATPALLRGHIPAPWLSRRELAGAASVLLGIGTMGGTAGCLAGAPAAVQPFQEQEALHIIQDEMSRRGVPLTEARVALPGVTVLTRDGTREPFVADLANAEHTIAAEYLTLEDYFHLPATGDGPRKTASALAAEVNTQAPQVHLGTFYNDVVPAGRLRESATEAERKLREQVKDFVDWLKAQGAI